MEEYWEQYKPTATSAAEHQEVMMDAWQRIVAVRVTVTLVGNPGNDVIDQGAEAILYLAYLYSSYMVCALVCTYVHGDDESVRCNTTLLSRSTYPMTNGP